MSSIRDRATLHGIRPSYEGADGRPAMVPEETLAHFLRVLGDEGATTPSPGDASGLRASCHLPGWLRETRAWGIALQLYELRSGRDWGIGDFGDLAAFCRTAAEAGADFVGLNPLHALFLAEPDRCSPFSPSNRRFLNPLYIAVDQVPGYEPGMVDAGRLATLRSPTFVDYRGVAELKLGTLRRIWNNRSTDQNAAFAAFRASAGAALERHATFEALSMHLRQEGHGGGWITWPQQYRRADSPEVARFAEDHAGEVSFHAWLQWLALQQLEAAADTARKAGMRIGLYLDFAVGEAPDGSAAWSDPDLVVNGIHVGAPPDVFSAAGQNWGLAPLSPRALAADDFAPYRSLMSNVMKVAGALRIDHVMSLRQLFWIPEGRAAGEGGFVLYPFDGLVSALAALSRESGTLVIGEDLGHVPPGFRDKMARAGIFSYRILYFEQRDGHFVAARRWPLLALACLSTHDLPTIEGWWAGDDIALRLDHALIGPEEARRQRRRRAAERRALIGAMTTGGVLSRPYAAAAMNARRPGSAVVTAAHRFIARTPCRLASLRLADAVGERHPTNLPGVADGYPNWRRKLAIPVEELAALPLYRAVTGAFRRERPQ